jgi:hypothetical protein
MKALRLIVKNLDEIQEANQKAEKLALPLDKDTKLEYTFMPIWFRVEAVSLAFITTDGYISATISGVQTFLKKDRMTWCKIRKWLE